MSIQGFERCLDVVLLPENDGQPFHTTPGDVGGATNLGITFYIYDSWCRAHKGFGVSPVEFEACTRRDFEPIYHAWYWLAVVGDRLPVGVDLVLFETAVCSGAGTAACIARRTLGFSPGSLDQRTINAIQCYNDKLAFIRKFNACHLTYLQSLHSEEFIRGWTARANRDEATAEAWRQNLSNGEH